MQNIKNTKLVLKFSEINKDDVGLVGGKNASLGEMFNTLTGEGVNIPDGFCITASAFWYFLKHNGIDQKLKTLFANLKIDNLTSLQTTGKQARGYILQGKLPADLQECIVLAYKELSDKYKEKALSIALRSSATAEDLPNASFAGAHETFLNVRGEKNVLQNVKNCFASLFNDRAIVYRKEKGFGQLDIALSVGAQKMVRSDLASSGIMFTMDTETGFDNVVLINSIYGIGELIVKGKITPDEFYIFKPTLKQGKKSIIVKNLGRKNKKYIYGQGGGLKEVAVIAKQQTQFSITDDEVLQLAKWALKIEKHYGKPQDMEWAKDGITGKLFIVQSRPETVHSQEKLMVYKEYKTQSKATPILKGIAVGGKVAFGKASVIKNIKQMSQFQNGNILVAKMTDPDWLPIMRKAKAIITDEGSRTCHAAIVARELGIPAIVGTKNATSVLLGKKEITVDCSSGAWGKIFAGKIDFVVKEYKLDKLPKLKTKLMLNVGSPETAFSNSFLPNSGVGLARQEFIIAEKIKIHPLALFHYKTLKSAKIKKQIDALTIEHKDKKEFYVKELAEGIGQISAGFYPKKVILRLSDLKTNEYKQLIGGELFEADESNPMLGFRGASRYYSNLFKPAFLMELEAIKRARDVFGLTNISLMVPFCRTIEEGKKVFGIMEKAGLVKGKDGLKVYMMAELPSNVVLAGQFLDLFDGFSIGSNDLTQMVLGVDRDNGELAGIGNETNQAVKIMIKQIIDVCKARGKYCGICGQAPSDFPEFAKWLLEQGIESISLNPDSVIKTILQL